MLPIEPQRQDEERRKAFAAANADEQRERLRLLDKSPHRQSAKARSAGRALPTPTDVDGLALFDAHRAPKLF